MNWKNVLVAQIGVLIRAAVMAAVFTLAYGVASGGPVLRVEIFAGVTLVLFIATNAVFWYAKSRKESLLGSAEAIQEQIDGK